MSVPSDRTLANRRLRDEIGAIDVAQGMLMERFQVSSQAAFDILRKHAQLCRLSISELALRLITTGQLL